MNAVHRIYDCRVESPQSIDRTRSLRSRPARKLHVFMQSMANDRRDAMSTLHPPVHPLTTPVSLCLHRQLRLVNNLLKRSTRVVLYRCHGYQSIQRQTSSKPIFSQIFQRTNVIRYYRLSTCGWLSGFLSSARSSGTLPDILTVLSAS